MFLGVDLGTSSVKVVLVDGEQRVVASVERPLTVNSPAPNWREQDPEAWWRALLNAVDHLHASWPREISAVGAIGLSGQMHGAVLLDASDAVLRPCILWNDGRSGDECRELEARLPGLEQITGNRAMPGFTAPKLLWVARHEAELFARTARVLLPKAWLRFRLCGEMIEDLSDASGTSWLDVERRDWSDAALAATGLDRSAMPRLVEGSAPAGRLRPELARRWGMSRPPVLAGGAGDNAAAAVGLSAVGAGDAFISLGSSGVFWVTTGGFSPYPEAGVHAFCHALPALWHQMSVTLSAASALSWWAGLSGASEPALLEEVGRPGPPGEALFLPYLAGERTPHDDPGLRAAFAGLSHASSRRDLTQAVMEGVAFSIRDGLDALRASGTVVSEANVVGGGSRSRAWMAMLASVLDLPLHQIEGGEQCGAFGAARLARLALTRESVAEVCTPRRRLASFAPDPGRRDAYARQIERYRRLAEATRHV